VEAKEGLGSVGIQRKQSAYAIAVSRNDFLGQSRQSKRLHDDAMRESSADRNGSAVNRRDAKPPA